jgi:hypothetical protein
MRKGQGSAYDKWNISNQVDALFCSQMICFVDKDEYIIRTNRLTNIGTVAYRF